VLEGRLLCRDHFHQDAIKKLEQYHSRLPSANESDSEKATLSKFVSEVISQTTILVSRTKLLSPEQRTLFLELSRASLQFYKRVQRNPRQNKRLAVLITLGQGKSMQREETDTINVSLKGACFESALTWRIGDAITIQRLDTKGTASARIARIECGPETLCRIGVEILDNADFWQLKEKRSTEEPGWKAIQSSIPHIRNKLLGP